jgi:hypothetical protein
MIANYDRLVLFVIVVITVICILWSFTDCAPQCKQQAQRCQGGVAQLCDTAGKWRKVIDCDELSTRYAPAWKCACQQEKCTCRRK